MPKLPIIPRDLRRRRRRAGGLAMVGRGIDTDGRDGMEGMDGIDGMETEGGDGIRRRIATPRLVNWRVMRRRARRILRWRRR
jgi:hypothetical protein